MEKKVRVELELTPQAAKELLDSGTKQARPISEDELSALAERGVILAADYLTDQEMEAVAGWLSKFRNKLENAISNKATQTVVATVVVKTVTGLEGGPTEEQQSPKR